MSDTNNENSVVELTNNIIIENCIYEIRGKQVMLDTDVAYFFDVSAKRINEQMKRNIDRFPEDFCFQLNSRELKNLRSQNATSKQLSSKRRYNPYVYTDHGIIALAGIIKSDIAAKMSVEIVRKFIRMRDFIRDNSDTLLKLAELQNRQISFEIDTSKRFDEVFKTIEKKGIPKQTIFYDGQYYDAYEFISELIRSAKESLIIIDPYCDSRALTFLKNRNDGVSIQVYKSERGKLADEEVSIFEQQYGCISINNIETIHDRFLIIDSGECYSLGASLNHAGKRTFGINKIEDMDMIQTLINKIKQ